MDKILLQIAGELKVRPAQVAAAVDLLDGGATVPFVARYRKEATGGLDDTHLRELEARLAYLRELEDRRATVLRSIDEQGRLTPELRAAIEAAPTPSCSVLARVARCGRFRYPHYFTELEEIRAAVDVAVWRRLLCRISATCCRAPFGGRTVQSF